eukprot:5242682-Prymnesium_polylepis.1
MAHTQSAYTPHRAAVAGDGTRLNDPTSLDRGCILNSKTLLGPLHNPLCAVGYGGRTAATLHHLLG